MPTAPLNVHFQQLAYLREVDRCATFTEAARRLHVSQPALSQSLTELERRLDVALFERSGRLRLLTAEGREVAGFARAVLAQAADLSRELDARKRGEGGILRVGMIDAATLYILPGAVRSFRAAHPQVGLHLEVASSTALLAKLRQFELDLAFIVGPVDDRTLHAWDVRREPLYLYAPSGDRRAPQDAEWALYPAGSQTRALIDAALARLRVSPRVLLESGNPQVLRQIVALGLGWSVLPRAVGEAGPRPLRPWRPRPIAQRALLGVRRRGAPEDPRADRFLALALQGERAAPAAARRPGA
jgi:DNA-binding transcriptional LysR family regulator